MRTLVVSSYPPRRCGIGAYARDQVRRLRAAGEEVAVLTAADGGGDVTAPLVGGGAFVRAAALGRRYDRVVVHFQPALYFAPRRPVSKVLTSLSLLLLTVVHRRVEVLVHEADPPVRWRPDYMLLGLALRRAHTLRFHTQAELDTFVAAYGEPRRAEVVEHRVDAVASVSRADARRRLGLPETERVLVSPGFLQRSKGFDRALRAFAGISDLNGASLYVVGSVREQTEDARRYVRELKTLAEATPGTQLVETYLDDEEFDLWIAAADRVVLPYRSSWSSGVLARAHALGTPAIVAAVGGLEEQADRRDVVVRDDADLRDALAAAIAGDGAVTAAAGRDAAPVPLTAPGRTRRGRTVLFVLIVASVLLAACAQLMLKNGMAQVTDGGLAPLSLREPATTLARIASNLWVWLGLATFGISAGAWLIVLSRAPLSVAYPFASLTYVVILLFDRLVLHEPVSPLRWGGVALIVGGIFLISRTHQGG